MLRKAGDSQDKTGGYTPVPNPDPLRIPDYTKCYLCWTIPDWCALCSRCKTAVYPRKHLRFCKRKYIVYLPEVVSDYKWEGCDDDGNRISHKYGCSGIDGLTFAPLPGEKPEDGMYLYVAYGIYNDVKRNDNDYQVILCYDMAQWNAHSLPLSQNNMHKSGFDKPLHKFFVYTGNTEWGVQNLEYDRHTNYMFMAVYEGFKKDYPNYTLFCVDISVPSQINELNGTNETAEILTLSEKGLYDPETGIHGWYFPLGSTGLFSIGNGEWLICRNFRTDEGQCGEIDHYEWNEITPFVRYEC